ncbi:hypothetical protein EVAR_98700_1 [Eumeta japonica]|uniref:Uncharacterized protein n=1 Tax=Eumeta variegata TaxID=151549 RepID=A0A4C1XZP2_EUMVA|nr:hypothetical protein EVAR_98700_1 [Eumeta japonica]
MMNPRSRMLAAVPGGSVEPPYAAARWRSAVMQPASSTDWGGMGSETERCLPARHAKASPLIRGSSRRFESGLPARATACYLFSVFESELLA